MIAGRHGLRGSTSSYKPRRPDECHSAVDEQPDAGDLVYDEEHPWAQPRPQQVDAARKADPPSDYCTAPRLVRHRV